MKFVLVLSVFLAAIVVIECSNTFLGTNVFKHLMYHQEVKYSSKMLKKRVEYFNYTIPSQSYNGPVIQGILAFDLTGSSASANVTAGGVGFRFVNLRMKSERGKKIDYDIYIYAEMKNAGDAVNSKEFSSSNFSLVKQSAILPEYRPE